MLQEDMGQLLGGDGFVNRDKDGHLGEHAHEGGDGVEGLAGDEGRGKGKVSDQIHGDMRPRAGGDWVGSEEAWGKEG